MYKVSIIDYGFGNQFSVFQAFKLLGYNPELTSDAKSILNSKCIILPGVGAFKKAMIKLKELGLDEVLKKAKEQNIPIIGICLGMQLLLDKSEEFGISQGLGLIDGSVIKLPQLSLNNERLKTPNIGWCDLSLNSNNFNKISRNNFFDKEINHKSFYFVHSFRALPIDETTVVANFNFGGYMIPAIIQNKNIVGFQFHPEKSGKNGLNLMSSLLKRLLTS